MATHKKLKCYLLVAALAVLGATDWSYAETLRTLKGTVVRTSPTEVDIRTDGKIVKIVRDVANFWNQSALQVGDEVVIDYVYEMRNVRNLSQGAKEKAGIRPTESQPTGSQPQKDMPPSKKRVPEHPPVQKDDRIFFDA